jgi:tRNA threonylcarbamoyladenosine biosynthesis protein TsaE
MPETVTLPAIEYSLEELPRIAQELITKADQQTIWLFYGDLGAGKTTLIKSICHYLGVSDNVLSSPTFSIINEYQGSEGKIFHADFYRIKNELEIFDLGIDEYFDSGNYCFIEWPERLGSLLPGNYFKVTISHTGTNSRTIEYETYAREEK